MDPATHEELASNCRVMRVCEIKPAFFPNRIMTGRFVATPAIFDLSSSDKEYAELRKAEPMLSVFDRSRTKVAQAKLLRGLEVADECVAGFSLEVAQIKQAAVAFISHRVVRVIRDPYTDYRANEPGGDGHAGVTGTDRRGSEERKPYKTFRTELARRCTIVMCSNDK